MEKNVENEKANIYGYARVSTAEQKEDRQVEALKEYGVKEDNIFIDKKSGKDFEREEYQLLKKIMKRTQNNVLIIKSIDRLGRNYKEILREWQELTHELKVDIIVLDMPLLDTTKFKDLLGTFISDLILQVLSFVAEQERENIRQRQAEGIAIAKSKNVKFGRPLIKKPDKFDEEFIKWKNGGQTAKTTMENLNLKRTKFYLFVKQYENDILISNKK